MRSITTPGVLLRSFPYSESSRILRFLTPDRGVVSLLARGVRTRGGRGSGGLDTFAQGTLTYLEREDRDLQTFQDFHPAPPAAHLGRSVFRFAGASLLAELLLTQAVQGGDPSLFEGLIGALSQLDLVPDDEVAGWILAGGWSLLASLGFTPELDSCTRCGGGIEGVGGWDVEGGGVRCGPCALDHGLPRLGPESRSAMANFVRGSPTHPVRGIRAHLSLLEGFARVHLRPDRGFSSFELLRPLGDGAVREDKVDPPPAGVA